MMSFSYGMEKNKFKCYIVKMNRYDTFLWFLIYLIFLKIKHQAGHATFLNLFSIVRMPHIESNIPQNILILQSMLSFPLIRLSLPRWFLYFFPNLWSLIPYSLDLYLKSYQIF